MVFAKLGRYWYTSDNGGRLYRAPYNSTEVDFDILYNNEFLIVHWLYPCLDKFGVDQMDLTQSDEREHAFLIYEVLNSPVCDEVWEEAMAITNSYRPEWVHQSFASSVDGSEHWRRPIPDFTSIPGTIHGLDDSSTIATEPSVQEILSLASSVGPGRTAADAIHVSLKRPRSPIDIVDLVDDDDLPAIKMRSVADELHLSNKRPLEAVDLVSDDDEPYRKIQAWDLLDDPELPDAWVEDVEDEDDSTYQPSMDVSSWHPTSQQARHISRDAANLRFDATQPRIDYAFLNQRLQRLKQPGFRRNWRDEVICLLDDGAFDRYMGDDIDFDDVSDDEDVPPHRMGPPNVPLDVVDLTDDMSEITGSSGGSSFMHQIRRDLADHDRLVMYNYNPPPDSDEEGDY